MSSLTPTERSLRARKAAHSRWMNTSSAKASEDARRRILDRFEDKVDPDRTLDPAERAKRADHARRAYFAGLALKSAQARRERTERSLGGDAA